MSEFLSTPPPGDRGTHATPSTTYPIKKEKKPPPTFKNGNDMITLYASAHPKTESILVHKSFACHYSPVLNAALNSEFIEGQTQSYQLYESDIVIIQILVHWFYTQKVNLNDYELKFKDPPWQDVVAVDDIVQIQKRQAYQENHALVKLWVLADYLALPSLQNLIIYTLEKVQSLQSQFYQYNNFDYVWKHTSKDSLLRKYLVAQCFMLKPSVYEIKADSFPKEMLIELVTLLATKCAGERRKAYSEQTYQDFTIPIPDIEKQYASPHSLPLSSNPLMPRLNEPLGGLKAMPPKGKRILLLSTNL